MIVLYFFNELGSWQVALGSGGADVFGEIVVAFCFSAALVK